MARMVKIKTVAEYLDMGESSVRRMIATGEIPAYRVGRGGTIRVDLDQLDEKFLRPIPTAATVDGNRTPPQHGRRTPAIDKRSA